MAKINFNPGKSAQFSNWEGRNTCLVRSYHRPTNKEEIQHILKEAYEKHEKVRVVGAGNLNTSFYSLKRRPYIYWIWWNYLREI